MISTSYGVLPYTTSILNQGLNVLVWQIEAQTQHYRNF